MKSSKLILLIAYGGGHMNIILSIYNILKKSNLNLKIFALTSAIEQCKKQKIPFESYKDYISDIDIEKYKKKYKYQILENHNDDYDILDTIAYVGKNLEEIERLWGYKNSIIKYNIKKRHSFFPFDFMKNVIKKNNPDLLIATNSPKSEYASVVAAKSLGIKTIQIDDLNGDSFMPFVSDFICANTKYSIPEIVSKGVDPKKIIVTGNPYFDLIYQNKIKEHKINNKVVFLSQVGVKSLKNGEFFNFTPFFLSNLLVSLQKHLTGIGKELIIRPHPNENKNVYKELNKKINFNLRFDKTKSILDSISTYANFISFNSTSLNEVYLYNRNVAELKISDDFESLNLSDINNSNSSIVSKNGKVKKLFFFKNIKTKLDGKNTKRVIDLINKILKNE